MIETPSVWLDRGAGCVDFRQRQLRNMRHRHMVLLTHEWLHKMFSFLEGAGDAQAVADIALTLMGAWIKNPNQRTERAAYRFGLQGYTRIYQSYARPRPFRWVMAASVAEGICAVRTYRPTRRRVCGHISASNAIAQLTRINGTPDRVLEEWAYRTLRRAIGFNPTKKFHPAWKTPTSVAIAKQIEHARDFSAMPILADALQDAGCELDETLRYMREDNGDWTLADWSLAHLLGYDN